MRYILDTHALLWHLSNDARLGANAKRILDDPLGYHPVFVAERSQIAALSFYVYAGAMGVLGQTVLAIRSTSAIAGLLGLIRVTARTARRRARGSAPRPGVRDRSRSRTGTCRPG